MVSGLKVKDLRLLSLCSVKYHDQSQMCFFPKLLTIPLQLHPMQVLPLPSPDKPEHQAQKMMAQHKSNKSQKQSSIVQCSPTNGS